MLYKEVPSESWVEHATLLPVEDNTTLPELDMVELDEMTWASPSLGFDCRSRDFNSNKRAKFVHYLLRVEHKNQNFSTYHKVSV